MAGNILDPRRRFVLGAMGTLGIMGTMTSAALPRVARAATLVGVPRTGVALGSGGLHGYAHVGVIRAFESLGFKPDVITGTSVGAIAGVLWASGARADEIELLADDPVWRGAQMGTSRFLQFGLGGLRALIDRSVKVKDIRNLRTRFGAVATDLASGELVLLDRGSPGAAVAASASVPIRYDPVLIGGRQLADGALSAPVPVDAARKLGAEFVIAIDVAYRPYEEPLDGGGMSAMAFQMMHIMINRVIREQIARADFAIRLDLHGSMQGRHGAHDLIAVGERATHKAWPQLQKRMAGYTRRADKTRNEVCAPIITMGAAARD